MNCYDIEVPRGENKNPLIISKVWATTPESAINYVWGLSIVHDIQVKIKFKKDELKVKKYENNKVK